jgi:hypothetical protein
VSDKSHCFIDLPPQLPAQYDGTMLPFFNITGKLFRRLRSCAQLWLEQALSIQGALTTTTTNGLVVYFSPGVLAAALHGR